MLLLIIWLFGFSFELHLPIFFTPLRMSGKPLYYFGSTQLPMADFFYFGALCYDDSEHLVILACIV